MNKNALDRLRIVRNGIVRQWQDVLKIHEDLPSTTLSKEKMKVRMAALTDALEEIHREFPELERIPMDQKPMCPFCGKEMDHPALADHMKEHLRAGDKIPASMRGIKAPCLWPDTPPPGFSDWTELGIPSAGPHLRCPGTPLTDDMEIGPIHLIEDEIFEVLIEGIKHKRLRVSASYDPHANGGWVLTTEHGQDLDDLLEYDLLLLGGKDPKGDHTVVAKNPDDPDETMDCVGCGSQVKLSETAQMKIGNLLMVLWMCPNCSLMNKGTIALGPSHPILAGPDEHPMAGVPVQKVDLVGGEFEQKKEKP